MYRFLASCCAAALLSGCASKIEGWIVNTRVHQGKIAMVRGNARDAELAYRLALRVNPENPAARAGFAHAISDKPKILRLDCFDFVD